jgi:transposase
MVHKRACRLLLTTSMTDRAIARTVGKSHNTIAKYRERLGETEMTWVELKDRQEADVVRFLNVGREKARKTFVIPDWVEVHRQMAQPYTALSTLWEEYRDGLTEGFMSESEFRRRYAAFKKTLNISMRQPRLPGYAMFVDYAGKKPYLTDPNTGEHQEVEMFVSVVGTSRKTFVWCSMSQKLPDFVEANIRAFEYYGCLPVVTVPDNLKAAVVTVSRKEGHYINPTFERAMDHYDVTVLPTRARKPKDKAAVENGVRLAYLYILRGLRKKPFYCIADMNAEARRLSDVMNDRKMKQRDKRSRNEIFEAEDRPVMRPLPPKRYEFAEWKIAITVPNNYHVAHEGKYYSVPHTLIGRKVDMAVLEDAIQFFHCNQLVATHPRAKGADEPVTRPEHQPEAHRAFGEDQLLASLSWAEAMGRHIHAYAIEHLKTHSGARSFAALRGLRRLANQFGPERLDAACKRALIMQHISNRSLESMLQRGMEDKPVEQPQAANDPIIPHENVRGAAHYD